MKNEVDPEENLGIQSHHGTANVVRPKYGIAKRAQEECQFGLQNQCAYHDSALPLKGVFKELKCLDKFATSIQDMLKMFKKSHQKESYLEDSKRNASHNYLHEIPSQSGLLIE